MVSRNIFPIQTGEGEEDTEGLNPVPEAVKHHI